jgi:hypothetical protein
MTYLIKSATSWYIMYDGKLAEFPTIEIAADFMVNKLEIECESIDRALIFMHTCNQHIAYFNELGHLTSAMEN